MAKLIDYNEKVLQVRNLKKYFQVGVGRRKLVVPAVDDVSFDIYKREVFGVVGESGSGKTTLGRTIIKLYQPTDGRVVLNNITISAGVLGIQEKIKAIRKKLKTDIISLNPAKIKAVELKAKAEQDIHILKQDLAQLIKDKATELTEINKQFDKYRADKYQLNALMQIELNAVVFEFNQKVIEVNRKTKNDALLKYNNEVKVEQTKLANKLSGLKDSAALDEKTIAERMLKLKEASAQYLQSLKEKYAPQIEEAKLTLISKQQAKTLIASYLKEKNTQVTAIRSKFKSQLQNLVVPEKTVFKANKATLDKKYQALIDGIQQQIKQIKTNLRSEILKLPTSSKAFLKDETIKAKIAALKAEAYGKINELKAQFDEARRINASKETLKESQKMQMIFQDPISSLNPRMTVREIVGEGLIIEKKLNKKEIDKKVEEALITVGLSPEYASRYPHEFSGGQRQRIGVARALIMNPNVIIADEPISALDVSIRAQIINLLFNLREKLDLTVLFIAHDLSVVRFFCDRIAVMFNGKVVELASSEELFKNPMHPYTISLLSAIPQPDPDYEKNRRRINYNPRQHDYRIDTPSLQEIAPNHFVFANKAEFTELQAKYKAANKELAHE